ncbi:hypothetical protein ACC738_38950 [Rhizobium ruizarguesonis]
MIDCPPQLVYLTLGAVCAATSLLMLDPRLCEYRREPRCWRH